MSQVNCFRREEPFWEKVSTCLVIGSIFGLILGGLYWLIFDRPNYIVSITIGVACWVVLFGLMLVSSLLISKARIVVDGERIREYDNKDRMVVDEPLASICEIGAAEVAATRDNAYFVIFSSGTVMYFEDQFMGSTELLDAIQPHFSGKYLELSWGDSRTKALLRKTKARH